MNVVRLNIDRRKPSPFGNEGPWLSFGKMGGLIITDRRIVADRRVERREGTTMVSLASPSVSLVLN
jgi:hypothetical protein